MITIIGGAALDVISQVSGEYIPENSNIGSITMRMGGSSRNAAECLARLGCHFNFISAVGDDSKGQMIVDSLTSLGLKNCFQVKKGERSACFNGFIDSLGNFKGGVADMKILEEISIEHISKHKIYDSQILVLDGNLSPDCIKDIFAHLDATKWPDHVILEPISYEKLLRIEPETLCQFTTIKLNEMHLEKLTDDPQKFLRDRQEKRIREFIVTRGENGVSYIDAEKVLDVPIEEKVPIKSVIGAGDSFMGGYLHALSNGMTKLDQLKFGQKCAALTIQSHENCSPEIGGFSTQILHNFNAGPCFMPPEVLQKAKDQLINYKGLGISVIEMSHRQKEFFEIAQNLEKNLRKFMKVPENFKVIYMQGGASQQFSAVAMNIGGPANFLVNGKWSQAAAEEAKKFHEVQEVDMSCEGLNKEAKYFHFCQNESIDGIELDQEAMGAIFEKVRAVNPDCIITADMSSAIGSRDLSSLWQHFGVIYAGAQKNLGTSGLTFVFIRDDILGSLRGGVPLMMDWKKHVSTKDYFVNTPSMFSVYLCDIMLEHMIQMGGIEYYEELAKRKAERLYKCLDSTLSIKNTVEKSTRSRMNVPFNVYENGQKNDQKEKVLLKKLTEAQFCGLEGHRSLGGLRASIYNSLEYQHVEALCDFLEKYDKEIQ